MKQSHWQMLEIRGNGLYGLLEARRSVRQSQGRAKGPGGRSSTEHRLELLFQRESSLTGTDRGNNPVGFLCMGG